MDGGGAGEQACAATSLGAGASAGAGAGAGASGGDSAGAGAGASGGDTGMHAAGYTVVVVGAGLAGATAAHRVATRLPWATVLVVEASPCIGGRLSNARSVPLKAALKGDFSSGSASATTGAATTTAGVVYDLGAAWTWPSHDKTLAGVARSVGVRTVTQLGPGAAMQDTGRGWRPVKAQVFSQERRFVGGAAAIPEALLAAATATGRVRVVTGAAVTRVTAGKSEGGGAIEVGVTCQPPAATCDATVGAGVAGAAPAPAFTPCAADFVASASHVIVAAPPAVVHQRVAFTPALPHGVAEAMRRTPVWMADTAKLGFTFETAFWRGLGLSGSAFSRQGPIQQLWDNTQDLMEPPAAPPVAAAAAAGTTKPAPPTAGGAGAGAGAGAPAAASTAAAPGALVGFVFGAHAEALSSGGSGAGSVVGAALRQLQGMFGEEGVSQCTGVAVQAWPGHAWIAPAPTPSPTGMPPRPPASAGQNGFGARELRDGAAFDAPTGSGKSGSGSGRAWRGRLHLAGTETEDEAGHMEGAAMSGLRAADAVVRALGASGGAGGGAQAYAYTYTTSE